MTLVHSGKTNGHDPHAYLKDVLERLPTQPVSRVRSTPQTLNRSSHASNFGALRARLRFLPLADGRQVATERLGWTERATAKAGPDVLWSTPWACSHRALAFCNRRGYADRGLKHVVSKSEFHGESGIPVRAA